MKNISLRSICILLTIAFQICTITVSAQQQIIVGTGTLVSAFSPIVRSYDYVAYEAIYLSSEINTSGNITKFAYNRTDGTNTDPIDSINIYMQENSIATLSAGNLDYTSYNLVYSGVFPNDSGDGWREVILDSVFSYTGTGNLQVLVTKGYQAAVGNTPISPRWYYTTSTGGNRARRYYGAVPLSTSTALSATTVTSNIRIEIGTVGLVELIPDVATIYPNPTNNKINIKFHNQAQDNYIVTITDISGRNVFSKTLSTEKEISIKDLSTGIYQFNLTDDSGKIIHSEKIIVQN
jgi:Secretion system C-terminal sorting domain